MNLRIGNLDQLRELNEPNPGLDFQDSDLQSIEVERPKAVENCSHIVQIRDGDLLTSTIVTVERSVMDRLIDLCGDRRVALSVLTRRLNGVLAYKRQQIGDLHRSESGRILWKSMFGITFNDIARLAVKRLIEERESQAAEPSDLQHLRAQASAT